MFDSYKATYDEFKYLNSNECVRDVDEFVQRAAIDLREYKKKLEFFNAFNEKIARLPQQIPMNFFLVDCAKLNEVASSFFSYLINVKTRVNPKFILKLFCFVLFCFVSRSHSASRGAVEAVHGQPAWQDLVDQSAVQQVDMSPL